MTAATTRKPVTTTRKPLLSMVSVHEIVIDPRYQRPVDEARARKIANEFRWDLFGVLEVSERSGDTMAIFDGQHRLSAAMTLELDRVPCLVHRGLSPQEEAVLFTLLQTQRRGLSQIDRFKAQVFSEDPRALAILDLVERYDFTIGKQRKGEDTNRRIAAVSTLERIFSKYGAGHLGWTLAQIRNLWSDDPKTASGRLIEGLAIFLAQYGDLRYGDAAVDRLRQVSPTTILRRAESTHAGDARASQAVNVEIRKASKVSGRPRTFRKVAEK